MICGSILLGIFGIPCLGYMFTIRLFNSTLVGDKLSQFWSVTKQGNVRESILTIN